MGRLYELNLSHNRLAGPAGMAGNLLGLAVQLQYLNLSNNRLEELPGEMNLLVNLREVAIAFNRFKALPSHLTSCAKLETIVSNVVATHT